MDFSLFDSLGFSASEAKVYVALLDQGKCAAQLLANKTKLPRSTVYSALESLVRRDLATRETKKGSTFFAACEPTGVFRELDVEKSRLKEKEKLALRFVEQMKPLYKQKNFSVPKSEFFEGKKNVERMLYDNLPLWIESTLKYEKATWGYQDHTFVEQFSAWLQVAWQKLHVDAGIRGCLISNASPVEASLRGRVSNREIRVVEGLADFESSLWIMGDYIVMIMTRNQPFYAYQIQDAVFARNQREVFRYLYEQGN